MKSTISTLASAKAIQATGTEVARVHDVFRERLPYKTIPTNLHGVYAGGLPDVIDPNTATHSELIKHGLLLPRPGGGQHPAVAAAWKKFFSRKWLAKDRIVPHLQPNPARPITCGDVLRKLTTPSAITPGAVQRSRVIG